MPSLVIAAEDNAGNLSVGTFVQVAVEHSKFQISEAQFSTQTYAARKIASELSGYRHDFYSIGEYLANP